MFCIIFLYLDIPSMLLKPLDSCAHFLCSLCFFVSYVFLFFVSTKSSVHVISPHNDQNLFLRILSLSFIFAFSVFASDFFLFCCYFIVNRFFFWFLFQSWAFPFRYYVLVVGVFKRDWIDFLLFSFSLSVEIVGIWIPVEHNISALVQFIRWQMATTVQNISSTNAKAGLHLSC